MPEPINYRAVLADLEAKRDALDAAIAAIKPFALGMEGAEPGDGDDQGNSVQGIRTDN